MANIILINPGTSRAKGINEATVSAPLGLAYIGSVLEQHNHNVQIIDANILGIDHSDIKEHFLFNPDFIGLSVNIITYQESRKIARAIKKIFQYTPIIFGGPYSSSMASGIIKDNSEIDAVVKGEGERTFLEIIEKGGDYRNIDGVVYRDGEKVIENRPRLLEENLDSIPYPAYHLLPDLRMYRTRSRKRPVGYVITSRGCPSSCTFCNRNIFGNKWRAHSPERVVDEILRLVKERNVRQIDILDDNFTYDTKRAERILDRLIELSPGIVINLQNGVRVDKINDGLLEKMKSAGVFKIGLGIESANKEVQRRIKKPVDLEKAYILAKKARSLGIVVCGFFILGLPGDNIDTMKETIRFSIRLNPHFAHFPVCIPFPGTALYSEIEDKGTFLINTRNGLKEGFFCGKPFFTFGSAQFCELNNIFKKAYVKFYLRPYKIMDVLSTIKSTGELLWLFSVIKDAIKTRVLKRGRLVD
jgi:anaerobic magnesium-protoporphyrin IX monomethyl ester cyclase